MFRGEKVHLRPFQLALLLLLLPRARRVGKVVEEAARLKQFLWQAPVFQLLLPFAFSDWQMLSRELSELDVAPVLAVAI